MFINYKNLYCLTTLFLFTFFVSIVAKAETGYLKVNYGISSHDMGTTTVTGAINHDDEGEGFIVSAGSMVGEFWGIDLMYYDLGSSTLGALDKGDEFKDKLGRTHTVVTAGTVKNDISGYGFGFIGASNQDSNISGYIKAGVHAWDQSGSTNLFNSRSNKLLKDSFFTQGVGAYGGVGLNYDINDSISANIAYDIIGLSKEVGLGEASTLISAGFKLKF